MTHPPATAPDLPYLPRIKICGLTRASDLDATVAAGADAIGFVFYPQSARYVTAARAAELVARLPPYVTAVGLFVNAAPHAVREVLETVHLDQLQFHGDGVIEDEAYCRQFGRPYVKALRVKPGVDLLKCAAAYPSARAILLDAFVEGYGGGGETFDWGLIPQSLPRPLILSGGLSPANVAAALRAVRPAAVDVSSGVEVSKGVKDPARVRDFIAAVRAGAAG